jgi:uncharacterized membrane protein YkvA (DUF1232 family)
MTAPQKRRKAIPLSQFIRQGASTLTAADIEGFHKFVPKIRTKLHKILKEGHHDLHREASALLYYADESTRGSARPMHPRTMFDCVFGLHYLLKGMDAIPDSVPDIGLEDDRIIVNRIYQAHEKTLLAFHAGHEI